MLGYVYSHVHNALQKKLKIQCLLSVLEMENKKNIEAAMITINIACILF